MNFGVLNNTPEKKYIQLAAVVVKSYGNATPKQWPDGGISYETECQCVDGLGQMQTLVATSKFADPVFDANDIDRPMDWKMKWFNTKQGAKISGYPLKPRKQGSQQPQPARGFGQQPVQAPQFGQQAPQQPTQPNFNPARQPQPAAAAIPYTPPQQTYTPVGPDETKKSIVWQGALKAAVEIVGNYPDSTLSADEYMQELQRWWAKLYPILLEPGSLDEDGPVPGFIANSPVVHNPDGTAADDGSQVAVDANGNPIPF